MDRLRRAAWLLIVVVDAGFVLWGAMAALAPEHLLGPGGIPILQAGYEGSSGGAWSDLPLSARGFMEALFRVYGAYNVAFGLLGTAIAATAFRRGERWAWWALLAGNAITLGGAMAYDWTANAIGPFELSEYLGAGMVCTALVVSLPVFTGTRTAVTGRSKPSGQDVGQVAGS